MNRRFRRQQSYELMGGMWFRVRQGLFVLLAVLSLLMIWQGFDNSNSHISERVSLETDRPVTMTISILGKDDGNRKKIGPSVTPAAEAATGCRIPRLDINGSEVIGFFKSSKPLNCEKNPENWAFVDKSSKFSLIPSKKDAKCFGVPFTRVNDDQLEYGVRVELKEGSALPSDFLSVSCKLNSQSWKGLLMSVVRKESRVASLKEKKPSNNPTGLNVFFLGFDSLSQLSFRRKLPKTVRFLEDELKSVVLNGYNIVGDGTPQAFIPILTGATEVELPLTRKRFKDAKYVDEAYPFAWKNFSDRGYATLYGEDAAAIGTFTYRLKGFRDQPTDHYTRTFFQQAEKILGNMKCLGSEPLHKSWLRYSGEFMRAYADIPRFLLMHHSMLSHDDVNLVGVIDDDLFSHLREMKESGAFKNTVVVVMADHGHRFASLRNTHQGQLEERLPFFSIALPSSFKETEKGRKADANLRANADRLSSPFDIHATLLDILDWPADLDTVQDASKRRSLSLFRPIPSSRSCSQAGIEPHWCICLDWEDALKTDSDKKDSLEIARAVVQTMNQETEPERALCAPLRLKELIHAKRLVPNSGVMAYKNVKDADGYVPDLSGLTKTAFAHYQLKLATMPGRAIYEVTVLYNSLQKHLTVNLADMSHINKFGDDPHCIISKNYFLATFCVCYDRI